MLGAGGQATVYKAVDTTLDRPVVIKVLPPELTGRHANMVRFEREAKLASSLDHPNICTIFGLYEVEGIHFIAMQYIEGLNVRQLVGGRPLSVPSALSIATQVADALTVAHARGIIHRDIKAGNVVVTDAGIAKVLDFGLAKLLDEPGSSDNGKASDIHLTELGVPYGTATYAAPEQAAGQRVDHRADIFSTGVLLYEMLAGTWPFRGKTTIEVRHAVVHDMPRPINEMRPDPVPARVQSILDRALAKDPAARYQKMEEMRDDLRSVLRELDIEGTSPGHSSASTSYAPLRHAPEAATAASSKWTGLLREHKGAAIAAAAVVVIALSLLAYGLLYRRSRQTSAAIDSLAVLPFTNASDDPNTEYLSDGMTESLINSLSQLPDLKVKSRNAVFNYKGRAGDTRKIGRELGVRALLSGRVVQHGDELAVTVELIDARDDSHIWGGQYSRKLTDVFTLQEEISKDVSEELRLSKTGGEQPQAAKSYAADPEAYRLYLKGRYYWNKRTAEGLEKGIEYFNQAIEKDPNYAAAYTGLADCYALLNVYNVAPATENYPQAQRAATKALALNERLAEAHTSLAFVAYRYYWNWPEAERQFKRAIELNPNYETAHQWYSAYLAAAGRHDEAITEAKRAQELEPFSLVINADVARHLYYARRYDEALAECRKIIEMDNSFARGHLEMGHILVQKKLFAEAIAEFQLSLNLSENSPAALAGLGHAYALAGKKDEALKMIKKLEELSRQHYVSPYSAAVVYAGLGDKEQAFTQLEKTLDERFNWVPFIQVEPMFDALRSEQRLADLLRVVGPAR
jgi:serine/threonine-protein kinase